MNDASVALLCASIALLYPRVKSMQCFLVVVKVVIKSSWK